MSNRSKIWETASKKFTGETIDAHQERLHQLMLACITAYGDEAQQRFHQMANAITLQLEEDLCLPDQSDDERLQAHRRRAGQYFASIAGAGNPPRSASQPETESSPGHHQEGSHTEER
jgi:hypothetical protein